MSLIPWWGNDRGDPSQAEPMIRIAGLSVTENNPGAIIGNLSASNLTDSEVVNFSSITIGGEYANFFTISEKIPKKVFFHYFHPKGFEKCMHI